MQTAEATPAAAMVDDNVQHGQGKRGAGRGRKPGQAFETVSTPLIETCMLPKMLKP